MLSFPSCTEFYLHLLCHRWTLSDFKIKSPKWTPGIKYIKTQIIKYNTWNKYNEGKSCLIHLIIIELTVSIGSIWSWWRQGHRKPKIKIKKNPTSCIEELTDLEFLRFLLLSVLWTFPPPISKLTDEYVHKSYKVGKTRC